MPDRPDEVSCACERHEAAAAVLDVLLARHPALVCFDDLVNDIARAPERPSHDEDDVRDGIADLVRDGLARRLGYYVVPTRAAVRGHELSG
jgi:hypothetical protein